MARRVVIIAPEGKLFERLWTDALVGIENISAVRVAIDLKTEAGWKRPLEQADLLIADLTGTNAGVMYATGWARALGKEVLFVVQHLEDFPFDRTGHTVISYAGDRQFLREELNTFLSAGSLSKASQSEARAKFTSLFGEILARHRYEHIGEIEMENATTFVLVNQEMDLPLVQDLARHAREMGLRLKLM